MRGMEWEAGGSIGDWPQQRKGTKKMRHRTERRVLRGERMRRNNEWKIRREKNNAMREMRNDRDEPQENNKETKRMTNEIMTEMTSELHK
jgi:hypothetical protein